MARICKWMDWIAEFVWLKNNDELVNNGNIEVLVFWHFCFLMHKKYGYYAKFSIGINE
jgi:hypothetical protein